MSALLPISVQSSFLSGVPVVLTEYVELGAAFAMAPGPFALQPGLVMHPLDAIAVQHSDDYDGRMQAAMDWIVGHANRRLDDVLRRLSA